MSFATDNAEESRSSSSSLQGSQPCRHFEFLELQLGTNNFDESLVIGHGGFGKVYKANVIVGSSLVNAAIKRLDSMSNQGATEFWAEVEMLSKLRHCNLVSLFGYCNYEKEMILVYEYMPNGTLEDHLHKLGTPLPWLQRLNICIGAARGLHYLHTGTGIQVGVIHRDVKSSNILLHESWAAKISDFGLSKIGPTDQPLTCVNTLVKGTFGYFDPDYFATGKLTRKSDVYAFGVILLEVLCRKRAVDATLGEEQPNLARWAQKSIKEGKLKDIIDSDIRGQISPKCLKEFVRIVDRCLHDNPKQRSTMAGVVVSLESLRTIQEKFNNSPQPVGNKTIFGRMVDMLSLPTNVDNSDVSGASDSTEGRKRVINRSIYATRNDLTPMREPGSIKFTMAEIHKATKNFSPALEVGQGGFGTVYKGQLQDGTLVAVKRAKQNLGGEYQSEIQALSTVEHLNLVKFYGYLEHGDERIVVVEYVPNGTLREHLECFNGNVLSLASRLDIAIDVAHAITYLHTYTDHPIIHRDIKSSNILLTEKLRAKVSDFGFALLAADAESGQTHVSTQVKGTVGYLDPEYMRTYQLTEKSDVYSFGILLVELVTGRRPIESKRELKERVTVRWAMKRFTDGVAISVLDPRLEKSDVNASVLEKILELALQCVASHRQNRPIMRRCAEVLWNIRKDYNEVLA